MKKVFEIRDGRDREVRLYGPQWKHICERHPEMENALEAIKLVVSDPDVVVRPETFPSGAVRERRVNSRLATHPDFRHFHLWVVIEYAPTGNQVVTAHVAPLPPRGELIYVRFPSL